MSYAYEVAEWQKEVDAEAARLVREGTPPGDAMKQAESIVKLRRQAAARRESRVGKPAEPR
jgi:hypothetical protein